MAENGSWIQKLFTSRDRNNLEFDEEFGNLGNTFVGEVGRLWYNPDTNCLYVSDGETPGGIPLNTCGNVLGVANIAIYDESVLIANRTASLDFVGAGVTATAVGNSITITIPGAATSGVTVRDEGNLLTDNLQTLDFVGTGVTATAVGNTVTVTVPTPQVYPLTVADEGSNLTQTANSINFVGNSVTATAVGNAITVTIADTDTSYPLTVQDEGNPLTTAANVINFVGEGVTANAVGNVVTITVPTPATYPLTIADEGSNLTLAANSINFVGNGVVATNTGNAVTVTVSGAGGISELYYGSFSQIAETTLTIDMNSNTIDPILVDSTAEFYDSGYIRIDSEVIGYTGKTATSFTGITRGQAGSGGSNHFIGDGVSQAQVTAAATPAQVLLNVSDITNGITLDPATGNVTVANPGIYNLQFSVQIENFSNDFQDTTVWFRVNGNDIPASASYTTTVAQHGGVPGATILTVNLFQSLSANNVVALGWSSAGGETTISCIPTGDGNPASPGVIFTVNRIS